jgi:hypothetical protein
MIRKIYEWESIRKDFTNKLLLGNGASIAVWDGFKYNSLYDEAQKAGRIGERLKRVFSDFATFDFEYILRLLHQTERINRLLKIEDSLTHSLYNNLRRTLIDTVCQIHPKRDQVKDMLLPIADFMKGFDTVLSLNYDLTVYWAMLVGNDKYGNWFKDGFVDEGRFDNDYDKLYEPYLADGATLVFYPHGNLILATTTFGDEVKLSKLQETLLLDTIVEKWETGTHIPLFVSEGSTEAKTQAVRRSNYLKTVYDREIDVPTESLVTYGWSFRDEDEHILRGIIRGGVERIAVSVHKSSGNSESFCNAIEYKVNKMYADLEKKNLCKLYFFDSSSDRAWINPKSIN